MTYTKIAEINCETGEQIIREMNADEKQDYDLGLAKQAQEELDRITQAEAKVALYAKLGITEEEARLLLS